MLRAVVLWVLFQASAAVSHAAEGDQNKRDIADRKFITLSAALVGSTIYDIESTYFAFERCDDGCYEANPIARPFVESGRPAIYGFTAAVNTGVIYMSYRLKASDRGRRVWWVPLVAGTAAHAVAGTMNVRLALSWK